MMVWQVTWTTLALVSVQGRELYMQVSRELDIIKNWKVGAASPDRAGLGKHDPLANQCGSVHLQFPVVQRSCLGRGAPDGLYPCRIQEQLAPVPLAASWRGCSVTAPAFCLWSNQPAACSSRVGASLSYQPRPAQPFARLREIKPAPPSL